MLDPMPARAGRRGFAEHPLVELEDLAIAGIANGVNTQLESGFHEIGDQRLVEAILPAADPSVPRPVGVVGEKAGASAA